MNENIDIAGALAKLDATFKRLQALDIAPTLSNMEKLVQSLYDLHDVHQLMQTLKGAEDGRT